MTSTVVLFQSIINGIRLHWPEALLSCGHYANDNEPHQIGEQVECNQCCYVRFEG